MIAPLGFHHVAIQVRDVEAVAAFYREVLGLPELTRHHFADGQLRSVWLSSKAGSDAQAGFFAVEKAPDDAPAGTLGYSMVALRIAPDARRQVEAALAARGVGVDKQTPWTLYVRDPEGNLVGLSHHPHPAGPVL